MCLLGGLYNEMEPQKLVRNCFDSLAEAILERNNIDVISTHIGAPLSEKEWGLSGSELRILHLLPVNISLLPHGSSY